MPTIFIFIGVTLCQNILITFLLFYGWLLFIPLVTYIWKNANSAKIQLTFTIKNVVIGIISGLICLASIYGFVFFFQASVLEIEELRKLLVKWDFSGAKVIILVLILILINPILEELYWREFMYSRLFPKIGDTLAILITSIFYTLYHLLVVMEIFSFPFNILAIIPVFLAGILWAVFRVKLNSIAAPIISHCLADIGIMLVYWNIII